MPHRQLLRLVPLLVVASLLQAAGCGGSAPEAPATLGGPTAKQSLEDLARLLEHYQKERLPMPAGIADVEPLEPIFRASYLGLVREEILYTWGLPLLPGAGDKVLAYEKKAEAEGGWVLLQDGTVKRMSQAELAAPPKARP